MDTKFSNGQTIIELLIALTLVLAIFINIHVLAKSKLTKKSQIEFTNLKGEKK